MRVVFMGFQTWGFETLKSLLASRHVISLVCTHPQSDLLYETIWNDSVKELALSHDIPLLERKYVNDAQAMEAIVNARPDVLLLSDWRTWVSPDVYTLPPFGGINIHDALLPKYGGFAPINWAIANGETQTGVTAHFLNEDFDLGDIILQEIIPIGPTETATDVFHKIIPLVVTVTMQALDLVEYGLARPFPQEKGLASFFHKRSEQESYIDWKHNATSIYNLIRAQSDPYPNAFTYHNGKKLMIKRASLPQKNFCGSPGRIFCRVPSGVVVLGNASQTHQNQGIILEVVQEYGKEAINANDYFEHIGSYLG